MAEQSTPKKQVGRPKGEPSTIVNIRLPLTLVARLDRHVDWVEVHSGVSTNRGTLTRRALQMFLDMHEDPRESGKPLYTYDQL
jgi:hypothetical protein